MKNIKMQKTIFLLLFIAGFIMDSYAQSIPYGSCGIVFTYDATGNRTKREYYCNNTPPGARMADSQHIITKVDSITKESFVEIDALYPNPTSGSFFLSFSKSLKDATIVLTDVNGRKVHQFKASGNKISVDLSTFRPGVYFVTIYDEGNSISKRVVKH